MLVEEYVVSKLSMQKGEPCSLGGVSCFVHTQNDGHARFPITHGPVRAQATVFTCSCDSKEDYIICTSQWGIRKGRSKEKAATSCSYRMAGTRVALLVPLGKAAPSALE